MLHPSWSDRDAASGRGNGPDDLSFSGIRDRWNQGSGITEHATLIPDPAIPDPRSPIPDPLRDPIPDPDRAVLTIRRRASLLATVVRHDGPHPPYAPDEARACRPPLPHAHARSDRALSTARDILPDGRSPTTRPYRTTGSRAPCRRSARNRGCARGRSPRPGAHRDRCVSPRYRRGRISAVLRVTSGLPVPEAR